jgi:hypothetical protein
VRKESETYSVIVLGKSLCRLRRAAVSESEVQEVVLVKAQSPDHENELYHSKSKKSSKLESAKKRDTFHKYAKIKSIHKGGRKGLQIQGPKSADALITEIALITGSAAGAFATAPTALSAARVTDSARRKKPSSFRSLHACGGGRGRGGRR